jgi:hypothetical protein
MSLIVPDIAKIPMQKIWTLEAAPGILKYKLFQNDYTPTHATILADLVIATFSGFIAKNLANPVTQAALDGGGRAVTLWDVIQWTKNGATGNTIYGYWCEDGAGNLLWVERFATGAYSMTVDGTVLQMTPKYTYRSQFSNS